MVDPRPIGVPKISDDVRCRVLDNYVNPFLDHGLATTLRPRTSAKTLASALRLVLERRRDPTLSRKRR